MRAVPAHTLRSHDKGPKRGGVCAGYGAEDVVGRERRRDGSGCRRMGDDSHDGPGRTSAMRKLEAAEFVALEATLEHAVEDPRRPAIIVTKEYCGRGACVVSRAPEEVREFRRERVCDAVDGQRVRRRHRKHDRVKGRADAASTIAIALCRGNDKWPLSVTLEAIDATPKVHGVGPRVGEQGRAHVAERPDGNVLAPKLRPEQSLFSRRELIIRYRLDKTTCFKRLDLAPRPFERVQSYTVTRQSARVPRVDDREHLGTEVNAQIARYRDGAEPAGIVGRPLPDV